MKTLEQLKDIAMHVAKVNFNGKFYLYKDGNGYIAKFGPGSFTEYNPVKSGTEAQAIEKALEIEHTYFLVNMA